MQQIWVEGTALLAFRKDPDWLRVSGRCDSGAHKRAGAPNLPSGPDVRILTGMSTAQMNLIWRFYVDEDRKWRWQRLSISREVVEDSETGYKDYEGCMANATSRGYTFLPPLSTRPEQRPRVRR